MTLAVCVSIRHVSCLPIRFPAKRKKRDAGHPVLAPDVLLEIYRHSAIIGREAYVTKGNIPYNRSDGKRRYKGKGRHAVPP